MLQTYCQKSQNSFTPSRFCHTLGMKNKGIFFAPASHAQKCSVPLITKRKLKNLQTIQLKKENAQAFLLSIPCRS